MATAGATPQVATASGYAARSASARRARAEGSVSGASACMCARERCVVMSRTGEKRLHVCFQARHRGGCGRRGGRGCCGDGGAARARGEGRVRRVRRVRRGDGCGAPCETSRRSGRGAARRRGTQRRRRARCCARRNQAARRRGGGRRTAAAAASAHCDTDVQQRACVSAARCGHATSAHDAHLCCPAWRRAARRHPPQAGEEREGGELCCIFARQKARARGETSSARARTCACCPSSSIPFVCTQNNNTTGGRRSFGSLPSRGARARARRRSGGGEINTVTAARMCGPCKPLIAGGARARRPSQRALSPGGWREAAPPPRGARAARGGAGARQRPAGAVAASR
jgi:hypothetical protein